MSHALDQGAQIAAFPVASCALPTVKPLATIIAATTAPTVTNMMMRFKAPLLSRTANYVANILQVQRDQGIPQVVIFESAQYMEPVKRLYPCLWGRITSSHGYRSPAGRSIPSLAVAATILPTPDGPVEPYQLSTLRTCPSWGSVPYWMATSRSKLPAGPGSVRA